MMLQDLTNIINKNINSITHLSKNIDYTKLEELFNILKDTKVIYFSGIGKNSHIANIIASTFNSLTIRSIFVDPIHAVHGDMGLIEDNSVVILVSKSGNTDELMFFCEKIKLRNCGTKIILLHSNDNAKLKKYCNFDLYVPFLNECDPWNRVPTCSLVCYLIILHSIGMKIVDYKQVTVEQFYKNHPGGDIGKNSK
jgi:arabinose-5-phosphate isomerase